MHVCSSLDEMEIFILKVVYKLDSGKLNLILYYGKGTLRFLSFNWENNLPVM